MQRRENKRADFPCVVFAAVPVRKGISAPCNVLIAQGRYHKGFKRVKKAEGPGGIAHPTPACTYHPAGLRAQYRTSKRQSKDGDGGGLKGNLCYSHALSVCANSKACKTKGLEICFFILLPSRFIPPFPPLWYRLNEHPLLVNSHDPQMKVRGVGVRETGVVIKGCHVPV